MPLRPVPASLLVLAALVLAAPIALALHLAWQVGWEPRRLVALGLTSLAVLALPLAACRTARQALWLYAPLAAYAALVAGVVPALGSWPHEGALLALVTTSGAGLIEGVTAFAPYVALSAGLGAVYLAACLAPGLSDVVLPRGLRLGVALAAVVYGVASAGLGRGDAAILERAYPSGLGYDLARLLAPPSKLKAAHRFRAFKPTTGAGREIHVLVLGESSRADHWQVNGYARPTSPRLMGYGPERLVSFADVSAAANLTLVAWPIALTRATVEDQRASHDERSVVALFGEAGFTTTWLSNQGGVAVQAAEADRFGYLQASWQPDREGSDLALVPLLRAELARKARRSFVVLHLMGSHGDYRARYGRRHAVFGDHSRAGGAYPAMDAGRLRDWYDNSIVANDELLDRVVGLVEAEDAVSTVTFMGDHGENLLDDERRLVWHGTATSSRAEAFVPFFVFPGARWRAAHPERLAALRANRAKPVAQTALFPTLAQLAGIRYPGEEPARSVADAGYVAPARRLTLRSDRSAVDVRTLR